jgi:polyisoprenoid-binding protein YceI
MKPLFIIKGHAIKAIALTAILLLLSVFNIINAQLTYQTSGPVKIRIEGTSNIHDWEMNAEQGNSTAVFVTDGKGTINGLASLSFTMPVESLKSEHTAMDKNAYKAMHTDKFNALTFSVLTASIKPSGSNYLVYAKGRLTINGVGRDVDVLAICTVNVDKTISVNGSYKLKMTSYNVTPPSIMLGAIKTGDDITVKFNLLFKAK